MQDWKTIELPEHMQDLERDERGFPIPFIVLRDLEGKPQFTANDSMLVNQCVAEGRCHICGKPLDQYSWFTGGPGAALLNGAFSVYMDGPMHQDCMHYALKVCPYLSYRMKQSITEFQAEKIRAQGIPVYDNTVIPGTPKVFVCVSGFTWERDRLIGFFAVRRPWRKVEYWHAGEMLSVKDGAKLAQREADQLAREQRQKVRSAAQS